MDYEIGDTYGIPLQCVYQKGDNRGCFNSKYAFVFLCTKKSSIYFRHIIKVDTSDRHDTDTVVIRKKRVTGLYSTAVYGLYFER